MDALAAGSKKLSKILTTHERQERLMACAAAGPPVSGERNPGSGPKHDRHRHAAQERSSARVNPGSDRREAASKVSEIFTAASVSVAYVLIAKGENFVARNVLFSRAAQRISRMPAIEKSLQIAHTGNVMKLTKTKLAAAAAITALGLGAAMPASAVLVLRVIDQGAGGTQFICVDNNAACDNNNNVNEIALNSSAANTFFGAAAGFTIAGASATAANPANQAQIDQSGNVTATTVPGILSIFFDATNTFFTLPGQNLRTLSTSGTATFTNSPPASNDTVTLLALNDPDNVQFGGLPGSAGNGNEFAVPLITFNRSVNCSATNPSSCAGGNSFSPFNEGDPFSLTNRVTVTTGNSTAGTALSVQFTASTLTFGTQQVVPEPTGVLLVGAGILGLGLVSRRKKN